MKCNSLPFVSLSMEKQTEKKCKKHQLFNIWINESMWKKEIHEYQIHSHTHSHTFYDLVDDVVCVFVTYILSGSKWKTHLY